MMSVRHTRRVIDHLRHDDYMPQRIGELARDLGVPEAYLGCEYEQ